MGTSYPGAIDALTNPNASDMLDSPPHSTQHGDANDAIEAIETKLGTGASTPTTVGHVLKVTGAGASAWQAPAATLTVKESDGSPSVADVDTMSFANATITDQGSGDVLITIPASLTVEEVDGSPSVTAVDKLIFPNGSVTDSGSGDVTIRDVPVGFIGASVYHNTTQAITAAAATVLFNSEHFDTDGFHSTSVNTGRMTIPTGLGGKYLVTGRIYFDNSTITSGTVLGHLIRDRGGVLTSVRISGDSVAGGSAPQSISHIFDLQAGDFVYLTAETLTDNGDIGHASAAQVQNSLQIVKLDSGKVGQGVGAKVFHAVEESVATSTIVALSMNNEEFDTDGFHDNVTNNSRLTVPTGLGGKYLVNVGAYFASSSVGLREVYVLKNGTAVRNTAASLPPSDGNGLRLSTSLVLDLAAGDYVEAAVVQTSGGALNTGNTASDNARNSLSIMRLDSGSANYTGPLWGSGTAFPSGPVTNQRFTRTDRGIDYYYDGTRWLSTTLYTLDPLGVSNMSTGSSGDRWPLWFNQYDVYLVHAHWSFHVVTTNDGSNYWTLAIQGDNGASAVNLGTIATASLAPNTWFKDSTAINALLSSFGTMYSINTAWSKTGTPGNLYASFQMTYRLVG